MEVLQGSSELIEQQKIGMIFLVTAMEDHFKKIGNYSAKKVKRSKKRLDRVFLKKIKMHPWSSFENILAK